MADRDEVVLYQPMPPLADLEEDDGTLIRRPTLGIHDPRKAHGTGSWQWTWLHGALTGNPLTSTERPTTIAGHTSRLEWKHARRGRSGLGNSTCYS
jgi:hypothetical protein